MTHDGLERGGLVRGDQVVHREQALHLLSERLPGVAAGEVADFLDELFGQEEQVSFGDLLAWAFAATVRIG
jgi:hypothetical protein